MLTTVKGTYHDGLVELDEPVAAAGQEARRVLVVFLDSEAIPTSAATKELTPRRFSVTGENPATSQHRFSFEEALALPVQPGSSVSDAVTQEREETNR